MKFIKIVFIGLLFMTSFMGVTEEKASIKTKGKVVIKYKKYTTIDLAGNTIQGNIRAPAVFYIFQRKRSQGHQVLEPTKNFDHEQKMISLLKENISQ